jgi:hypothetical protein
MMSSRKRLAAAGLVLAGPAAALALPEVASAHGLSVGRQDLPIPDWLFAWAASLVLIVSFAVLSLAWRTTRLQEERWRALPKAISRALINPVVASLCGAIGIGLVATVVYSGLEGTADIAFNFSGTFIFVTFWLGMVVLSVLFGDVFRAFSPWRALARIASAGVRLIAGQPVPAPLRLPERLGCWPAVVGLVGFVWLELVYGAASAGTRGISPHDAAVATLVYSAITFVGMALFGIEEWVRRGETFSVYFGMLSRISFFEVRDGTLGRRRVLSGLPSWEVVPGSLALALATIGTTSFDGAQEGVLKTPITNTFEWFLHRGFGGVAALRITNSIFLVLVLIGVSLLFWLGVRGMHTVSGSPPVRELAHSFAHTLVPIALAYLVAHYFSLFVFQEQAQFTYLLSDPLGEGSNIFGTANCAGPCIDYGLISPNGVWYMQVGALIVGHVAGLTLAHDRAIAVYDDYAKASRSQYWMLAVMVSFTCLGLFLLSQGNS